MTSAFPSVATTANGTDAGSATSATVQLPSGIVAGDRLLIVAVFNGAVTGLTIAGFSLVTGTGPSYVVERVADGSEGSSIAASWTTARSSAWYALRIINAHRTQPAEGATGSGTSANPDPPALTASWGPLQNLWIVTGGSLDAFSGYPTGYTNNQYTAGSTTAIASATASLGVATQNPGAFTIDSSQAWRANTVVIRPL